MQGLKDQGLTRIVRGSDYSPAQRYQKRKQEGPEVPGSLTWSKVKQMGLKQGPGSLTWSIVKQMGLKQGHFYLTPRL